MLGQGLMKQMGWIYRPAEEVEEWKAKDPIPRFEKKLVEQGVLDESKKKVVWDEVKCLH